MMPAADVRSAVGRSSLLANSREAPTGRTGTPDGDRLSHPETRVNTIVPAFEPLNPVLHLTLRELRI